MERIFDQQQPSRVNKMDKPLAFLLICLLWVGTAQAAESMDETPRAKIALIIDDMGNQLDSGRRAVMLPGPLTYAFLPHTPYVPVLANLAHRQGKQVMLHQPLESYAGNKLGPGGLTLHMPQRAFKESLMENIVSIPHIQGVNNHMGSLMTRHPGAMRWLMEVLGEAGLFFVDSRTTEKSIAHAVAKESSIATINRDVFLDHNRDEESIRGQFERLLRRAKLQGSAVGIGHPYPETLAVLEAVLPQLAEQGIELVLVSELTEIDLQRKLWRVSSTNKFMPPTDDPQIHDKVEQQLVR